MKTKTNIEYHQQDTSQASMYRLNCCKDTLGTPKSILVTLIFTSDILTRSSIQINEKEGKMSSKQKPAKTFREYHIPTCVAAKWNIPTCVAALQNVLVNAVMLHHSHLPFTATAQLRPVVYLKKSRPYPAK